MQKIILIYSLTKDVKYDYEFPKLEENEYKELNILNKRKSFSSQVGLVPALAV